MTTSAMINNPMTNDLMNKSPIALPIQYIISYIGILITIVSGIAMLKGKNWARFLYIIWNLIGFAIGIIASPIKMVMIPGFVVFLVAAFFLLSREANKFFTQTRVTNNA
jgi:hypothetical protein